ncbi:MAG: response regulator [Thermodesulfobacteriota bacterium]
MEDRRSISDSQEYGAAYGASGSLTLLLIDDVPSVLKILEEMLVAAGHTVVAASNGRDGLRLFNENRIDAILCDLNMPEMDGWMVARVIREVCKNGKAKRPPFFLVTAMADQIRRDERIDKLGIDAVIAKPVDIVALLETIQESVQKHSGDTTRLYC